MAEYANINGKNVTGEHVRCAQGSHGIGRKNSSEKVVEAVGSLKLSSSNDDDADADDVASIEKINSLVVPESKVRSDQEVVVKGILLAKFPREIIVRIFEIYKEEGDACSPVQLGLSCKAYYNILKFNWPESISILPSVFINCLGDECKYCNHSEYHPKYTLIRRGRGKAHKLYTFMLMKDWMGLRYRFAQDKFSEAPPRFLNRDVYGEECGDTEIVLYQRWHDHYNLKLWTPGNARRPPTDHGRWCDCSACKDNIAPLITPSPYRMGMDWYAAATQQLAHIIGLWTDEPWDDEWDEHQEWLWEDFHRSSLWNWMVREGLVEASGESFLNYFRKHAGGVREIGSWP